MFITKDTELYYDYFNPITVWLNGIKGFYYERWGYLDKYSILEDSTDKILVCSETKDMLLDYLVEQKAYIEE